MGAVGRRNFINVGGIIHEYKLPEKLQKKNSHDPEFWSVNMSMPPFGAVLLEELHASDRNRSSSVVCVGLIHIYLKT